MVEIVDAVVLHISMQDRKSFILWKSYFIFVAVIHSYK